jgi:hypothetical protein
MMMESWRQMLTEAMHEHGETWNDVEEHTLMPTQLDQLFDSGFGEPNGASFTLWTRARVYFPATYDGAEWVASVARHPDGVPTRHIGASGASQED